MTYREIPYDPKAEEKFNAAVWAAKWRLRERVATNPNQAKLGELLFAACVLVVCSASLLAFSTVISLNIYAWFANKPIWVSAIGLMVGAVVVGFAAWFCREFAKSRIYPLGEIIFGAVLAAQGPLQVGPSVSPSSLAGIVAFVGGVRIIIDGFKRFFEHKSYRLFSMVRVRYNWRNFKRWARSWSYSV
jgi:hypothetical protein